METTCFFLIVWIMLSPIHQILFTTVIFTATFSDTQCLDEKLPNLATFSLKVLEFQNHARRRVDGKCCGKHVETTAADTCKAECSLEFRICIEPFAIPVSLTNPTPYEGPCLYGQTRTGHWGNTDMAYKPANAPTHSINITMPWPVYQSVKDNFLLKPMGEDKTDRSSEQRSFSVILEAYDLVTIKEKYLIDRAIHRSLLRPIANAPPLNRASPEEWHHVTITTQLSGYTFSMRLACQPDRYNNTCTKVCMKNSSRYTCDANGDKVCEPGWSGSECDTAVCKVGCHPVHGSCTRPGDCDCATGWQGVYCDECIKYPGCKYGTCNDAPFTCHCLLNWGGPFCDQDLDYCGRHQPCRNGGICKNVDSSLKPFNCSCPRDYTGEFCEIKLAPCSWNPCKRGRCLPKGIKGYVCECEPGWRGDHCEESLTIGLVCGNKVCHLKYTDCIALLGDITQTLKNAVECLDVNASWNELHLEPCEIYTKNLGVTCVYLHPPDCHLEYIDYCLQNSCLNGGTCQDLDGIGFRCLCPPGFKGANCQLRSPCSNSRCVHARDCTQLMHPVDGIDYACSCQPGWTGQFCDQNINDCVDKCQNGGTCHDLLDDFYCTCPIGFTGRFCEVNHECAVQPCKNNGICREITGGYRCECPDGFTGYHCEIKLSSCNPNPCQNGAYCYTLPHGFYCKCSAQHYGQFCEHERPYCGPEGCEILLDPCLVSLSVPTITDTPQTAMDTLNESQRPDLNRMLATSKVSLPYGVCGPQGTCVSTNEADGGYVCVCGSGFQGKYCHEPVNHCEEDPCLNGGTCINGLESYECLCEDGFVGEQCETPLDLCEPNPCQNGGYCQHTVHPGDFQCRCAPGWSGRWCQLRSEDPCSVSKICFNNGVCRPDSLNPGGFRCDCEPNWIGSVCQLRLPDTRACADKALCKNGATCVDVGNSFNCICRPGYDGRFCENDINECNSMPCYNNGTCRDLVNSFECDCPKGFIGTDCRININECATNPCAYGATCVDRVGDYECLCPEGRHGRHCDEVTIYTPPKPPACNFHDRIYDHGEMWVYNCQRCQCNSGQMICTDDFCGYWSCLHAMGQSDRFACKSGEVCHILSTGSEGECFVAPCYLRTVCLNATQSIPLQLKRLLPNPYPGPAIPGCRPNAAQLNNRCARIQLQFSKSRMPYGVTVGDVCTAIRELPSMVHIRNSPGQERGIGMSCDIKAIYGEETRNVIEVTLSSTDEQLRTGDDGKELSFVHKLARNVSQEMAHKAASNITVDKELRSLYETRYGVRDDTLPLPPMTMLLGTKHIDKYWHRVLLGVVEIHVDTMVVREKDLGSPILVPLVCGLILLAAALCIVFICFYAQRKHRQLILKYAPSTAANNDPSAVVGLLNKGMTNTEKKHIEKRHSDRYPNAVVPPNSGPGSGGLFSSEQLSAQSAGQTAYVGGGPGNYRSREYGQEVGTRNVGAVVV